MIAVALGIALAAAVVALILRHRQHQQPIVAAIPQFAAVLTRKPLSLGAHGRLKYQEALATEFRARFSETAFTSDVYLRIVWFCRRFTNAPDSDNIIKPISDALKTIVYADDKVVVKCASERVDVNRPYSIDPGDAPESTYEELLTTLADPHDHVLYIEVGMILRERATALGYIDGRARA